MAHFAELDSDNNVLRVIVVNNDAIVDENGNESESIGRNFCRGLLGGRWVQTSFNGSMRGKFACAGMVYDEAKNMFTDKI